MAGLLFLHLPHSPTRPATCCVLSQKCEPAWCYYCCCRGSYLCIVVSFVVVYYASAFNLELAGQRTFWPKYSNDFQLPNNNSNNNNHTETITIIKLCCLIRILLIFTFGQRGVCVIFIQGNAGQSLHQTGFSLIILPLIPNLYVQVLYNWNLVGNFFEGNKREFFNYHKERNKYIFMFLFLSSLLLFLRHVLRLFKQHSVSNNHYLLLFLLLLFQFRLFRSFLAMPFCALYLKQYK